MGSAGRTWREIAPPHPTYYVLDPMGMALPMSIGLAVAQPKRQIVLLNGDGDFCTGISALLAVVEAQPKNLKIAVFNSGRYESGGAQRLPAANKVSIAAMARGAGLGFAEEVSEDRQAADVVPEWIGFDGPALVVFRVEVEASPYLPERPWAKVEDRAVFMRSIHGESGPS
ncbi:MAG: thiamine pyrophosphate-dependent enzyme [Pseudolabrys sp.]